MGGNVATLQDSIACYLENAAIGYLNQGMDNYKKPNIVNASGSQVILGNVAIAIELMLRSFIARHNPVLVFRDSKEFPNALKVLFASPERLTESPNWKVFDFELRSGRYKTIDVGEGFEFFELLFPELAQELAAHLDFVNKSRNVAVHYFSRHFQEYELDRAPYVALLLLQKYREIENRPYFDAEYRALEAKKIDAFIKTFDGARIDRVRGAQEMAKDQAKAPTVPGKIDMRDLHWDQYIMECDICHSDALLTGSRDIRAEEDQRDGSVEAGLEFRGHSFRCDGCGLELKDTAEMRLASVRATFDRFDQMDEWNEMHMDVDDGDVS